MGTLASTLENMERQAREQQFNERLALMEKHGVGQDDIDKGRWKFVEEGSFASRTISLWKLADRSVLTVECKTRVVIGRPNE